MGSSEDHLSRGVAAAAVVLLHGLALAALNPALHIGYLGDAKVNAYSYSDATPAIALVMISVATPGPNLASSPVLDRHPLETAITDVQRSTIQPRDFVLSDAHSEAAMAPRTVSRSGEVGIVCEVHIHQGRAGQVQAVDFGVCTGDSQWQHSLLESIQQAARLVTPMQNAEFPAVRTLMMDTALPSPEVLAHQLAEPNAH